MRWMWAGSFFVVAAVFAVVVTVVVSVTFSGLAFAGSRFGLDGGRGADHHLNAERRDARKWP